MVNKKHTDNIWAEILRNFASLDDLLMSQPSFAQIWDLRPFLQISSESPGFLEVPLQKAVGGEGMQSEVRASRI